MRSRVKLLWPLVALIVAGLPVVLRCGGMRDTVQVFAHRRSAGRGRVHHQQRAERRGPRFTFYPRDAMLARLLAMVPCLSVSVTSRSST